MRFFIIIIILFLSFRYGYGYLRCAHRFAICFVDCFFSVVLHKQMCRGIVPVQYPLGRSLSLLLSSSVFHSKHCSFYYFLISSPSKKKNKSRRKIWTSEDSKVLITPNTKRQANVRKLYIEYELSFVPFAYLHYMKTRIDIFFRLYVYQQVC